MDQRRSQKATGAPARGPCRRSPGAVGNGQCVDVQGRKRDLRTEDSACPIARLRPVLSARGARILSDMELASALHPRSMDAARIKRTEVVGRCRVILWFEVFQSALEREGENVSPSKSHRKGAAKAAHQGNAENGRERHPTATSAQTRSDFSLRASTRWIGGSRSAGFERDGRPCDARRPSYA